MKVLKFGGTSVGSPERLKGVKKIIESQKNHCLIVVSAFQGVTDELKHLSELASDRDDAYELMLDKVISKHIEFIKQLIGATKQNRLTEEIKNISEDLKEILSGIYLLRELSKLSLDQILGTGEILSSLIISNYIEDCQLVDARNFIKTDSNFGFANVDFNKTDHLITRSFSEIKKHIIVPFDSGLKVFRTMIGIFFL